jgi:serine/threonine protein phosphatase Stp1
MSGFVSTGATHAGAVRRRNEDAFVDRPEIGLWAVADGAGGHGAGDVASAAIADALAGIPPHLGAAELLAQVRLRLSGVHASLQMHPGPGGRTPASTVVALLARGGHFAVLWAGDSRGYLLRGGGFTRLTRDHSLVQEMVDAGVLSEAEAERHPQSNVITRAVGAPGELELDKMSGPLLPGDVFLLCSDGLFKEIAEAEIAALLGAGQGPEALIAEAVRRGARDNVTAVAVRAG